MRIIRQYTVLYISAMRYYARFHGLARASDLPRKVVSLSPSLGNEVFIFYYLDEPPTPHPFFPSPSTLLHPPSPPIFLPIYVLIVTVCTRSATRNSPVLHPAHDRCCIRGNQETI